MKCAMEIGRAAAAAILVVVLAVSALPATGRPAAANGLGNEVIYSIIIDRFFNAVPENDIPLFAFPGDSEYDRRNRYWLPRMHYRNASRESTGGNIESYWGGDLQGVIDKLDYLHWLGVTVIVLSPVVENVNGIHYTLGGTGYHGYWAKDFFRLEEHFVNPPGPGESLEDVLSGAGLLKALVDKAHAYDPPIRVVLDVVLNHTSPAPIDTTLFDENNFLELGAVYEDGVFRARPCTLEGGRTCRETATGEGWFHPPRWVDWSDPSTLVDGWINGNLADLDQRTPAVRAMLMRFLDKWLALGIDGFRIDAAKHIYPAFIADVESRLVARHPDIILIAEYFEGGILENGPSLRETTPSVRWLQRFARLTMFDFSFADAVRDYFRGRLEGVGAPYFLRHVLDAGSPHNALAARTNELVTFVNNQDIPRFLSLDGATTARYHAALKLMFVAPGVPTLFYGDEIGLGYRADDPLWQVADRQNPGFSRPFMAWERMELPEVRPTLELTRSLAALRRANPFLKDGRIAFPRAENLLDLFEGSTYLAVERGRHFDPDGGTVFFLHSLRPRERLVFETGLPDGRYTALDGGRTVEVRKGRLVVEDVAADESLVLVAPPRADGDAPG